MAFSFYIWTAQRHFYPMSIFRFGLLLALGCICLKGSGQTWEGVIQYDVQYVVNESDRPDLEVYKNMIPSTLELSVQGSNSLMKFKGGTSENLLGEILFKSKENALYTLTHANRSAVKTSVSTLQNPEDKVIVARKTSETSTLDGFVCRKYLVKDTAENTQTEVWCASIPSVSTELMVYFLESMTQYQIKNLEGLPLKIAFKGKEFDLNILAKSIIKKKMPHQLFSVPEGYTVSKTE